ncbi:HAD family hydrolase [Actinocatenispora sera]|uniref:Hydrolase n=2 Tax=Actinocatenispora sera TaxID=390989 RepID=A0A810L4T5_9ACTN|nr:HAD-IA family hydrolase [Actinocatenispora sera]BCJ29589.1 hydrolase [Actinocatenispora sera]BCJ29632.1 hydrolase [Actinocatenispora sera]BCJ29652.1 hydrolase [Actinocatenispora sera]BCJ29672.1 hydrolase [Actinocatenispora sera]
MTPAQVLASASLILLDFDGPTAHLFAGASARTVADRLAAQLAAAGVPLPDDADQYGPPELGAELIRQHRDQADTIEALVSAAETEAARTAEPTPGCRDMLDAAQRTGRPVVIVSNNSAAAVCAYLDKHHLTDYIAEVIGRPHAAPELMKPNPWPVHEAARRHHVPAADCVLIGDSATDIEAAQAAGAASIGYVNKPGKAECLNNAGATVTIADMHDLADAIHRIHDPSRGA